MKQSFCTTFRLFWMIKIPSAAYKYYKSSPDLFYLNDTVHKKTPNFCSAVSIKQTPHSFSFTAELCLTNPSHTTRIYDEILNTWWINNKNIITFIFWKTDVHEQKMQMYINETFLYFSTGLIFLTTWNVSLGTRIKKGLVVLNTDSEYLKCIHCVEKHV